MIMEAWAVDVKPDRSRFQELCNSGLYSNCILFLVDNLQDCHTLVRVDHRCGNSISCRNKQILCRTAILENYLPLIEKKLVLVEKTYSLPFLATNASSFPFLIFDGNMIRSQNDTIIIMIQSRVFFQMTLFLYSSALIKLNSIDCYLLLPDVLLKIIIIPKTV